MLLPAFCFADYVVRWEELDSYDLECIDGCGCPESIPNCLINCCFPKSIVKWDIVRDDELENFIKGKSYVKYWKIENGR